MKAEPLPNGLHGQTYYPHKHAGALLVVGSAPCALEDFAAARKLYPTAAVMAINEGAGIVPADFIASLHPEQMAYFAELQRKKFGTAFTTHSAAPKMYDPAVNFYWSDCRTGATSAWCGVKIGKVMGFGPIILCGCPMNGGDGYAVQTPARHQKHWRFGDAKADSRLCANHRESLAREVERGHGANVFSMSGYTRELLGAP